MFDSWYYICLTVVHGKMVYNTFAGYGCNVGYNMKHEKMDGFSFTFNKSDLITMWIKPCQ